MPAVIMMIVKNLIAMIVGPKMVIWVLEIATKSTKNKIDDDAVKLIKAGYENDVDAMKQAVESLVNKLSD